jgi:hypothetical protein
LEAGTPLRFQLATGKDGLDFGYRVMALGQAGTPD